MNKMSVLLLYFFNSIRMIRIFIVYLRYKLRLLVFRQYVELRQFLQGTVRAE